MQRPPDHHQADQPRDRQGRFHAPEPTTPAERYRRAIEQTTGPAPIADRPPAEPPGARVDPSGWYHTTEEGDDAGDPGNEG